MDRILAGQKKKKENSAQSKKHKKIPEFQGSRTTDTFKRNILSIQSIENNITTSFVFPAQLCHIFTFCHICFRSTSLFLNTDLAEGFYILYHYPAFSAEVTTILNLVIYHNHEYFKMLLQTEICSIV